MSSNIKCTPKLVRNSISDQNKTAAGSLTIKEWNTCINILKTQANFNTEYLEKLHTVLFGAYAEGELSVLSVPEIQAALATYTSDISIINKNLENLIPGKWHIGTLVDSVTTIIEKILFVDKVIINDLYLNANTGDVYRCTDVDDVSIYWSFVLNIKGISFIDDTDTTNIIYTLIDNEDKTFLMDNVTAITLTIPATVYHGFCNGINIKTGADIPSITFINNSVYPLKLVQFGFAVENYIPLPNKTVAMSFYSDGINIYCYINEV